MRLTYAELYSRARGLASLLIRTTACAPDDCIWIMLSKSAWVPVVAHAIQFASAAYVPIDPELPVQRIADICADARIRVMCTSNDHRVKLPASVLTVDV